VPPWLKSLDSLVAAGAIEATAEAAALLGVAL
jgi:hypothetical protein